MSSEESEPDRERWPSRLSFVLASMGGAVGIGNLLRYPSVAAKHFGLQWFIPYLLALFGVGLPILALEIALGQTMRGAAVVANNAIHRRLRGLGTATALIALITVTYYVVIMAWVCALIRHSFRTPLPWRSDQDFFFLEVVRNVESVREQGARYLSYPGRGVIGETLGWAVLTWALVYLCIFRGVAVTGRIVYITMLVPLLLCVVLLVRAVTMRGARDGIVLYLGRWDSAKLRSGTIWRDAIVQIFFSIGTGFGYFMAYASYNAANANGVQDALIIALSNSAIEVIVGIAAFAVVGARNIDLSSEQLGTFVLGFLTYPAALAEIPGGNAWSFFFFLTIYLLAIDSAFALLEAFASCVTDTNWGGRLKKHWTIGIIVIVSMLFSFIYTTQFGLNLLDSVDTWLTGITLTFVTFFQCFTVTSIYRYNDVIEQTGYFSFWWAQCSYLGGLIIGILVWQFVDFGWGVLTSVWIIVIGTFYAAAFSNVPTQTGCFGSHKLLNSVWWLTSYSVRCGILYRRASRSLLTRSTVVMMHRDIS